MIGLKLTSERWMSRLTSRGPDSWWVDGGPTPFLLSDPSENEIITFWRNTVVPMLNRGVNPANLKHWFDLRAEVRTRTIELQIDITTAQKIQHRLDGHVVTSATFLDAWNSVAEIAVPSS